GPAIRATSWRTTSRRTWSKARTGLGPSISPFLDGFQAALSLRVVRRDLQRVLVAALRARGEPFHLVQVAERDEGVDFVRIERQGALKTLRRVAAPFRIAFLAGAEKQPGVGVIGDELDRLFEQHDGAVIV